MNNAKKFRAGKHEYAVTGLSPDKAIDFCTDATITLAPILNSLEIAEGGSVGDLVRQIIPNLGLLNPERVKKMLADVRASMILPNGNLASAEFQYHEWFMQNPSELMISHVKGAMTLLKDFFPQELGTILAGTNLSEV